MKLIVIGGSSFIGRNLLEELVEGSYPFSRVTATFSHDTSFLGFSKALGIEAVQYDVINEDRPWDDYEVCIYLAGNSDHNLAIQDPARDLAMNTQGLLRFLRNFHGHLVYMSSGAVYYGLRGYVNAKMPVAPTFSYGISKLACEHYVKAFYQSHSLASYVILRLFYAYGKYDKPRRLIPQVVKAILCDKKKEFYVRGSGKSFMDPVDARYVARVLAKAALAKDLNATLDLCGGYNQRVIEVVNSVAQALGKEIKVVADGTPEVFPVEFYSSPEPAIAILGLKSPPSLEEGVKAYASWALR
ncbi:MAG: NAD(P)-dependent oxidoreductase [Candidatus Methanomethylicaceae archaeon]